MKTLLILRHAKSSWAAAGVSDHERPLNPRGQADAPQVGRLLRQQEIVPSLIISSSARRAVTTANLAADAAGFEGELRVTRQLYHADPETYLELLRETVDDAHDCVMVVGHNPGMEELVSLLTDWSDYFTTANLAQITLPIASWKVLTDDIVGELVAVWRPRELD